MLCRRERLIFYKEAPTLFCGEVWTVSNLSYPGPGRAEFVAKNQTAEEQRKANKRDPNEIP
jgi:hypothetical protein